jgi:uncharacterized protein (DUF885 family)
VLSKCLIVVVLSSILAACSSPADDAAERVNTIASEFVHGYYSQFPEEVYEVGYPDAPNDRFGDHSPEALAAWDAAVDAWLAALDAIDPATIAGTPAAITYQFTRERLQALAGLRVCRNALWEISPTFNGWQSKFAGTFAIQPVATAAERRDALNRAADVARYLAADIGNLRLGQDTGYLAPQSNVEAVLGQLTSLIESPAEESPFYSPAARSDDEAFIADYRKIYDTGIRPAMVAYRDFLANEYHGRDQIGVSANPDGEACYAASVRYWVSLPADAGVIHRTGLSEMSRIRTGMLAIARESFGTDDLNGLLEELRTNPEYTFKSGQAVLDFVNAAVDRSRSAVHDWFGVVPDAEVLVFASPDFEKDSGSGFYAAGSPDGSRPGTIKVGTWNPTAISQAGEESLTFHEGYPGHHLQVSVALLNDSLHPILRYMYVSGSAEGWGLYSEGLADEMGLYSSEVTRIGMLSDEALRAARLVVDPGIHVFGWTRDDAIQYMLENTAKNYDGVAAEIDRYAAAPGQATSYLLGSLDIRRLRHKAEVALGDKFDIREFHDRLLADGGVTLPMLEAAVDAWIAEQ